MDENMVSLPFIGALKVDFVDNSLVANQLLSTIYTCQQRSSMSGRLGPRPANGLCYVQILGSAGFSRVDVLLPAKARREVVRS